MLHIAGALFVIRAKSNTRYRRHYPWSVDKLTGVKCNQTVIVRGVATASNHPQPLHPIRYYDEITGKTFNLLTNNYAIPAQTIADLYRYR